MFVERLWRGLEHEDIYLKACAGLPAPVLGLAEYFAVHSGEWPHQGLGNCSAQVV